MGDRTSDTERSVTATFTNAEAARSAIGALEDGGVDGSRIVLLGQQAAEASQEATTARQDERFIDRITKTIAGGMVFGGLVGATLGFIAAFFAFILPEGGSLQAGGVWALVVGGLVVGHIIGFLIFGLGRMKQSQAWERSYADVSEGPARVGVRSPDPAELATAVTVLREHHATEIEESAVDVRNEQTTGVPRQPEDRSRPT